MLLFRTQFWGKSTFSLKNIFKDTDHLTSYLRGSTSVNNVITNDMFSTGMSHNVRYLKKVNFKVISRSLYVIMINTYKHYSGEKIPLHFLCDHQSIFALFIMHDTRTFRCPQIHNTVLFSPSFLTSMMMMIAHNFEHHGKEFFQVSL